MTTTSDFGFPQPKKRLTKYGRSSRKNTPTLTPELSRDGARQHLARDVQVTSPTEPVDRGARPALRPQSPAAPSLASAQPVDSKKLLVSGAPAVGGSKTQKSPGAKRKMATNPSAAPKSQAAYHDSVYSPPSSPPTEPTTHMPTLPPTSSALLEPRSAPAKRQKRTVKDTIVRGERPLPLQATVEAHHRPTASAQPRTPNRPQTPRPAESSAQPPRRRKRLIDDLVAQVAESSGDEDASAQATDSHLSVSHSPSQLLSSSPAQPLADAPKPHALTRQVSMPKKPGPRFTYSQERTMLAEDPILDTAGLNAHDGETEKVPFSALESMIKTSTLDPFSFLDEDDDTANAGAVRSLHELRQAGANSRFADEMDDILDRVGSPGAQASSLRRGALLELAQKIGDKSFSLQFRNHSGSEALFRGLDQESDLVAAFAIAAILTSLLSTSNTPHIIRHLQSQGVASLLAHLLEESSDIIVVSKERKRNVSKIGQSALHSIKQLVLQLPVWKPLSPSTLSPRTLALKALELLLRQRSGPEIDGAVFSTAVTDVLFSVLSDFANPARWDFPNRPESVDFCLTLQVLEIHSVSAVQSELGPRWTTRYLPIVADILEAVLRRPTDKYDELEDLALRLTLNTSNDNPDASAMFVHRTVLRDLAETACRTFQVVLGSIKDGAFLPKVCHSLIMMLGVLVNFCKHYNAAARSLFEGGEEVSSSPVDGLIRVFLDYHSTTSDADSIEKSQLNVAFGYLSAVLGFLCLHRPIRERFVSMCSKHSLEPLLDSLREFAVYFKLAAHDMADHPESISHAAHAEQLEGLVDRLRSEI